MRENRTSGSEGGGMKPINLPTPIDRRACVSPVTGLLFDGDGKADVADSFLNSLVWTVRFAFSRREFLLRN